MTHSKINETVTYFLAAILGGFIACEVYTQLNQHATDLYVYAETVAALVM